MTIAAPVQPLAVPSREDGAAAPDLELARAGEIEIAFARPLIGLERSTRYVVRPLGPSFEPYAALVSRDERGLAFMVVPPAALFDDYVIEIPEDDAALLELKEPDDAVVLVIVRRRGVPTPVVNLLAPVVVNRRTRVAAQVVLQESGYGVMVPVDAGTARPGRPAQPRR